MSLNFNRPLRPAGIFVGLALAITFFLSSSFLLAQTNVGNGSIQGTVTDPSGAVVNGAKVTITEKSKNSAITVTSDSKGAYTSGALIPGAYVVRVEASGFKVSEVPVNVQVGNTATANLKLEVGQTSQVVEVEASTVSVNTEQATVQGVITENQIENLPVNGRNFLDLAQLEPGVQIQDGQNFDPTKAGYSSISFGGRFGRTARIEVDGVDVSDETVGTTTTDIPASAIQEFQISQSSLDMSTELTSSGAVNVTTKSGGNGFHGEAFGQFRDSSFAAALPTPVGFTAPFQRSQYGGSFGGPVIKNKLFFFLGYQGLRNRVGATTNAPVFSPSQIAGNFSGDNNLFSNGTNSQAGLSTNPIPFAINGCAAGTPWNACFSNGNVQLAQSTYNPTALTLLQTYVPAPNGTIGTTSVYNFNSPNTAAQDQGIIRADYHLSDRDSLWGSSVFQSSPSQSALGFNGSDLPGFGTTQAEHFKLFMASWTHTFNTTTLNELRAGYFRFNFASVEPAQITQPSSIGFNIAPQSPSAGIPLVNVTGLNGNNPNSPSFLGFSNNGPQPRKDTNLTGADNFTKILGNHSLKLGVSIEQFVVNNPYFADNNGSYNFTGTGTYSSGDPIVDFVLGIPDQYTQTSGSMIDARAYEYYVYGQDSWKITNDLTINYGISWDVETPNSNHQFQGLGITCWTPGSETSAAFPGGPPGLTFPTDPGCNKAGGPTTKWDHFGPRLGFAWSPSSGPSKIIGNEGAHDFAVRGGFGLYYNRDAEEGQLQNLSDPPWLKNSFGAADFGGSPGFTNPFADVAGNGSEANPFPYNRPLPGDQLNWSNYSGLDISTYPTNYSVPYTFNFNLNVQRSLPSNMVLQIGYVGSIGRHLVRAYEGDTITPAGHAACLADPTGACPNDAANLHLDYPQYFTQPATDPNSGIPWYLSVGQQHTDGSSSYHSLQTSLSKGPTHGLSFTLAYTFSHALDNSSGLESSGFNGLGTNIFPGFQYLSYGDSDFDARHRFVASYDYEIPILSSWKSNRWMNEALGGWHISGVTALQTGFPVTISQQGAFSSLYCDRYTYYSCPDTPNTSSFSIKSLNPRSNNLAWFDSSVFSPETVGTFGNVKRNFFHGPGFNYTNLELAKNIPLGGEGERYLQLRLETFNAFNHANFSNPDGNFSDGPGQFGTISSVVGTSTADVNGDPQPGRAVQLAAKFYF